MYPELLRTARSKILGKTWLDTREAAELWCEERAISSSDAIAKITGWPASELVTKKYETVFKTAEEAARKCVVEMGGPANLDLLYWIAEYLRAERIIETGVAYGWSSLALLLSVTRRNKALLVSLDRPSATQDTDKYIGCVIPEELRSRWRLIKGADRDELPKVLKELRTIDLCHYDSDKSYRGRIWAYPRLWKALRTGGCFISDDIGDNLAFREFCSKVNADPIIVRTPISTGAKYVGIVMKN